MAPNAVNVLNRKSPSALFLTRYPVLVKLIATFNAGLSAIRDETSNRCHR